MHNIINPYGCIYGLRSPSNKWYIGQTTCVDPYRYIDLTYKYGKGGLRSKINNAILKYGFETFEVKIFVYLFNQDNLNTVEIGFIEMFDSIKNGYNCREGGSGGKLSQETKDKIGFANSGKSHSDKTRLKMSLSRKLYLTEDIKEFISKSSERLEYLIEDIDGKVFITTNLRKFSKEHGLRANHLYGRGSSKGWRLISKRSLDLINQSKLVSIT